MEWIGGFFRGIASFFTGRSENTRADFDAITQKALQMVSLLQERLDKVEAMGEQCRKEREELFAKFVAIEAQVEAYQKTITRLKNKVSELEATK